MSRQSGLLKKTKLTIPLQNAILYTLSLTREYFMASRDKKQTEKYDDSFKSEIMHRLKTHPVLFVGTVVILIIVIVAFVFVPAIVPNARRGEDLTFGSYDKMPISYVRDNYFYQVQQSLSRDQQPSSDDPNYIFTVGRIWRQAFEETAIHLGMLDEVKQAGYIVPEDVVDRQVAELPMFSDNGRFSAVKYRAMDKTSRMNLWRQVQDSIAAQCYTSDFSSLKTASKEAAFISSMASPRRTFNIAIFPLSSYPDSEITLYAETNQALFRVVHLSRITVNSSEREAQQVLDSVKNGTSTFEEAAKTNSQDTYADKGGDMGIRMAYELVSEITDEQVREKIISLPKGELSDLVKVTSGWAFFRAEEAGHPADMNDPSQKDKIRNYIMVNSRGQVEDWTIGEAQKFCAQAKEIGFDEAVSAGNIAKNTFGPIPVNYGNSAIFGSVSSSGVPELASAGTNQFFWKAAFSTPLKSLSDPLVVGDNVIVLLPLEESNAEDNDAQFIEMYLPYWINAGMEQAFRVHFLTSDKLVDRFNETFWKIWGRNLPNSN